METEPKCAQAPVPGVRCRRTSGASEITGQILNNTISTASEQSKRLTIRNTGGRRRTAPGLTPWFSPKITCWRRIAPPPRHPPPNLDRPRTTAALWRRKFRPCPSRIYATPAISSPEPVALVTVPRATTTTAPRATTTPAGESEASTGLTVPVLIVEHLHRLTPRSWCP